MKIILTLLCLASPAFAAMKVASLHPIVADLARQVGGANVEVVEILKPGGDIHHFEPATKDIAAMRGSKLILASGKGLPLSKIPNVGDNRDRLLEALKRALV